MLLDLHELFGVLLRTYSQSYSLEANREKLSD